MSTSLLLTHLRNQNPNVPLSTLSAALSYHLSVDKPNPTPLAAAAVSSPFFLSFPHTHEKLQELVTAFRHAVHLKDQALTKQEERWSFSRAVFSKSAQAKLQTWVKDVLSGLQGGLAVVRLACYVGLLLGVRQLVRYVKIAQVENEVVIALAEVLDNHTLATSEWEKEFWPHLDETSLSLTLILASQSVPHIPRTKLKALPLCLLSRLLTTTICSAFNQGNFLSTLPKSSSSRSIHIPSPSFALAVQRMSSTPTMLSMPSLSKLMAILLEVLIDSIEGGLEEAQQTLETFQLVATRVEWDWMTAGLPAAQGEEDAKEVSRSVWLLLKTLLFSTVMIANGALESIVYTPPKSLSEGDTRIFGTHLLAGSILRTFSHLSFVISEFGGVAALGSRNEPGFTELRKVFYLATDVFCSAEQIDSLDRQGEKENICEMFVKELVNDLRSISNVNGNMVNAKLFQHAKITYALACIEQLVPLLREPSLKNNVWDVCAPYLSDPSHRETYESAHSVVLAVFAAYAQRHRHRQSAVGYENLHLESDAIDKTPNSVDFIHQLVPFYARCLIQNSKEGFLSIVQLRLAYATLVKGACANPSASGQYLGWHCITLLSDTIAELSNSAKQIEAKAEGDRERLHRLHLALVSTIPSLPLTLLIHVLEEIRRILTTLEDPMGEERKELLTTLFSEILEGVGDREKEATIQWWYANRESFGWDSHDAATTNAGEKMNHTLSVAASHL